MSLFQIEKNVPLEPYKHIYPFGEMNIGESFIATESRKARTALSMYCRRHPGREFKTRKVDGGIRIWRVA